MIKDKLPDKGNEFEKPGASSDDTIKFILINLDEMNRLWIRLSYAVDNSEINKEKREKERDQLKILVGENINRLSSLNAISAEIYQKNVLPKIIEIVLDSNDILYMMFEGVLIPRDNLCLLFLNHLVFHLFQHNL